MSAITGLGGLALLFFDMLRSLLRQLARFEFRWRETLDQIYSSGVKSLPILCFSMVVITLMLLVEFSFHMKLVLRQDSLVPAFSSVMLARELGPVVTAVLLTSRVGAGMAAELGTMKLTEQLDALSVMGVDRTSLLVVPRWLGCVVAAVASVVITLATSIFLGGFLAVQRLSFTTGEFFNSAFLFFRAEDLKGCVIKAAVFGTLIPLIAVREGFRCQPGSRGVGNAATNAVVRGSVGIILFDFVLTYWLYR